MEKLITYWHVRTLGDAEAKPQSTQLDGPPATTDGLYGDLHIENDDQIMVVFFEDQTAHERVTRAARDAASVAQEWQVPHRPARHSQETDRG